MEGVGVDVDDDDDDDPDRFIASQYKAFRQGKQPVGCVDEVAKYLMENIEGENDKTFNILAWWKYNTNKYSILSRLARDVLAVPVSTVASESAFSTGGRILDPFRSSLALEMVQSLICTQNWLQSSVQISLRQAMDDVELFEDYGKFSFTFSSITFTIKYCYKSRLICLHTLDNCGILELTENIKEVAEAKA
ncbi:uncharacterized protein LOC115950627 isoform X2 [Quercus lobata]|uniref:uncharacterized protein LOC115950627 isoform X2 n=1 Tax=Quercus lobata TaxID=97700 RepID=UPI0012485648|nr:uncharacterized protein LOC115950627 isoform X2 [Quercus lobata]